MTVIDIISIYHLHFTKLQMFLNPLHELIHKSPTFFPLIIIGDFNVDMLQTLNVVHQRHNSKYFQIFMNQQILQIQLFKS